MDPGGPIRFATLLSRGVLLTILRVLPVAGSRRPAVAGLFVTSVLRADRLQQMPSSSARRAPDAGGYMTKNDTPANPRSF